VDCFLKKFLKNEDKSKIEHFLDVVKEQREQKYG